MFVYAISGWKLVSN